MDSYQKVTIYRYRLNLEQVVIDREQFETIDQNLKSIDKEAAMYTASNNDYWAGYYAFQGLPWEEFSWGYSYSGSVVPDGYGQVVFAGDMDMYGPWIVDLQEGAEPPWVHSIENLQVNDVRQSKVVLDKQKEYGLSQSALSKDFKILNSSE